jgi:hypothetical protein
MGLCTLIGGADRGVAGTRLARRRAGTAGIAEALMAITPKKPVPTQSRKAVGRPSEYKVGFVELCRNLCLLGLTDERIAELIGISERQMIRWKKMYPAFRRAFERGRDEADAKVAKALYQRAIGYSHPAEKLHFDKDGNVHRARYIQHYPPDTAAAAFYLSNRSRAMWRTKPDGEINVNISLEQLVLGAIKLRESEQAKVIENKPQDTEPKDAPKLDDG